MSITVAIVEDKKNTREDLIKIIESSSALTLVAAFANGESFLAASETLNARIVLMDINLPGKNGVQCITESKQRLPETLFIMHTTFEDDIKLFAALQAGARGYILKSDSKEELVSKIIDLAENKIQTAMSPVMAIKMLDFFVKDGIAQSDDKEDYKISVREHEVLVLLSQGITYKEIADKMNISKDTVDDHIKNIYRKLQVHSRHDAVNKFFKRKFFSK